MRKKTFWDNPDIKNNKERLLIFFELVVIAFSVFNLSFTGRVFPNVYVSGISLGGKTESKAVEILKQNIKPIEKVILTYQDKTYDITAGSIDLSFDIEASVQRAMAIQRTGNIIYDLTQRVISLFKRNELGVSINKNEEKLDKLIGVVSDQIETAPVYPSLSQVKEGLILEKGSLGYKLDKNLLKAKVGYNFSFLEGNGIEIPLDEIDPRLNQKEEEVFLKRGNLLKVKKLLIYYSDNTFSYSEGGILSLIGPYGGYNKQKISQIITDISNRLDSEPVNSTFVFSEGRVKEFTPSKDGVKVEKELLMQKILGNLKTLEETDNSQESVEIPVTLTAPQIKTADVNNLGINELIGKGVSYFAGSIPGRVHNINLASNKFTGVLVKPGDTLSFSEIVGDISSASGYKRAYVISGGKTILGDGGGVCQVSTTLFRAALAAGLPITERTAHAYRVGYYEQHSPPGIDATVYVPSVDLKIKNDTLKHILIQTKVDNKKMVLVFEIYGTNDGRKAVTTNPVIKNQVAPPPDVYQDDPTQPIGTVTQTEHKAWGATVTFNYTVEKEGEITYKKTFTSRYQPWAAVYLRGTALIQ